MLTCVLLDSLETASSKTFNRNQGCEVTGVKLVFNEKGIWLESRATPVTVFKCTFNKDIIIKPLILKNWEGIKCSLISLETCLLG